MTIAIIVLLAAQLWLLRRIAANQVIMSKGNINAVDAILKALRALRSK